jgi:site-specific DNA-methyltransferase (adenine-specific)
MDGEIVLENTIFNEDNLITLNRMSNDYLDLTITSPPYNVDLGNNKYNKYSYDVYNDNKEHHEYIDWLMERFDLIYRKTTKGGRCVINIGDPQNGKVPAHSDVLQRMVKTGWIPMAHIIWDKSQISNRTSWGSFKSPSAPSFPLPFEYIMVFAKESTKLVRKGETDLTGEEFIKWSLAKWTMATAKLQEIGHPAAFPLELPVRCIKMLSWVGAVVYDPFMGSGTTAIAAKALKRKYIGSEISKNYYALSLERLGQDIPIECGLPKQNTVFDL